MGPKKRGPAGRLYTLDDALRCARTAACGGATDERERKQGQYPGKRNSHCEFRFHFDHPANPFACPAAHAAALAHVAGTGAASMVCTRSR
ncbi:protein of unknown function (plasmid) [Thiomonas sp. Sup16B3]|nr:protein of unknown function [Thiomonas sp. Sup16B3]